MNPAIMYDITNEKIWKEKDFLHYRHHLKLWKPPKTTLGFDNLLEELIKLTKSYFAYHYGLLQGKNID